MRGAALMEFALAWPVALLLVLGCVELAVWQVESYSANSAALAGARAGSTAEADPRVAADVTLRALAPGLVGVAASAWCPGGSAPPPRVWVCAVEHSSTIEVQVGGDVPALVPLFGAQGLPLHANVALGKERFST